LYVQSSPKIFIYDLNGNYKRSFLHNTDGQKYPRYYDAIYNFNRDYLLCFRDNVKSDDKNITAYLLVSKQTGEKIKDIYIPFDKLIKNYSLSSDHRYGTSVYTVIKGVVKNKNYFILNDTSSDTIYQLAPDFSLTPIMTRIPSIQQMEIPIFLGVNMETERYLFMTKAKLEEYPSIPCVQLVYDKHTGEIREQNFYNGDDLTKKQIDFGVESRNIRAIDNNRYYLSIPADQLKEAYENSELTGKLKEIASKITEDDNPVLMVVKL
jgi:hypothetical protein